MVHFVRLISAAALASVSSAAPMVRRGSAIGIEAAPVSAPNGIPITETSLIASSTQTPTAADYGSSWGSSSSGDSSYQAPPSYGDSSYGDSSSVDSSSWDSTSSVDEWASSTVDATSSAWSSVETIASETSSSWYSVATYGSGSSSWGGSSYDDCVQQCSANYGQPSLTWSPSSTQASDSGSSGGNGVTHTIVVAPTQGVLRYIPFSTNASVGDTISFQWGAGPHTVTQSSALEVCNHTDLNGGGFASGMQNKGFVFNQVVNDTKPIWFYCGVPTHCQKGMFGGVNIGQADPTGSDSSIVSNNVSSSDSSSSSSSYVPLSSVMSNLTASNEQMGSMWSYTKSQTGSDAYANSWGLNVDCSGMSNEAMMQTAENVMYMQTLIAKNPQAVKDGKFTVTDVNSMKFPMDLPQALAASNTTGTPASAASSTPSAPSNKSGALSIASSSVAVGLIAVAATFFTL